MKKCLLCDAAPVPDDVATCPNDGEATWGAIVEEEPVDVPLESEPADLPADAPKRRSRK